MIAIMAMGANAQITWNVRAGAGVGSHDNKEDLAFSLFTQSNIPFSNNQIWTFSPTIQIAPVVDGEPLLCLPLLFGYKNILGNHSFIIPKLGPFIGYDTNGAFMVGPSVELAFEIKHFVVALNGVFSFTPTEYDDHPTREYNPYNFTLSIGYKF